MHARCRAVAAPFFVFVAGGLLLSIIEASTQQSDSAPRPPANVPGITSEVLVKTDVPGAPSKMAVTTRVTYEPGARNHKHYHTSQVVFYILDGEMTVQNEGKDAITLKPGETLLVKPATVHAHWNASTTAKLVFLEFILLDEGQRSTVPMQE